MTYAQSKKGICVFGHVRSNALLVFQNLKRAFTISLKTNWKSDEMRCDRDLSRAKLAFVFFKHVITWVHHYLGGGAKASKFEINR